MAYVAQLSFLSDPTTLLGGKANPRFALCDEDAVTKKDLEQLLEGSKRMNFVLPAISHPASFSASLFKNPSAISSIDFSSSAGFCPPSAATGGAVMAMKKGTTTLAFTFKGGIIMAADARGSMGTFVCSQTVMKVIEISDCILGTIAGGAADCSYWERHLSLLCRLFQLRNGESIPVAAASNMLANIFYHWKAYGLVCGTMIAGWNTNSDEPELYYVDNDAARVKGKLFSVGSGSTYAYGVLDSAYKWDLTDEEAVELAQRAIYQAAHRDGGSGGSARVYHIQKGRWTKVIADRDISELHYEYAEEKGLPVHEL